MEPSSSNRERRSAKNYISVNDNLENSTRTGTFTIPPGKEVHGELTFSGPSTSLYLHDKDDFDLQPILQGCVKGILHDLTKVTLVNCIPPAGTGYVNRRGDEYHYAKIFPHYIVSGDDHITPDDKTISEVRFVVDDANTLFYDFDAFGIVIDPRPFIEQIAHANGVKREITIGPHPEILYYTVRPPYLKQIQRSG
jgi:hypothetical protein